MGTKGKVARSAQARCNKTVIMCQTIEVSIITFAYIIEVVKHARTVGYVALVALFALLPVIAEWIIFKKDNENKVIKHIVSVSFAIFYALIMLTTNNILAFVYAIPMLFAITVYSDVAYIAKIISGAVIINIVEVVIMLKNGYYTSADTAKIEIQVLVMIIMGAFAIYATKVSSDIAKERIEAIASQEMKVSEVLGTVRYVAGELTQKVDAVNQQARELNSALVETKDAMNEVNIGSTDTANAVQDQLTQTEEIQDYVTNVLNESKDIIASVDDTMTALDNGNNNIEKLMEQASNSVNIGSSVRAQLEELNNDMGKMTSIIDIITEITTQTSLLALNASIEAARAGEAGKGFAVVASEITHMADQTQDATVKINDMINGVSESIANVINATTSMIHLIQEQDKATGVTAESFKSIKDNSTIVSTKVTALQKIVEQLNVANSAIVDSISTVSSISEEVTAHATETLNTSEANLNIIDGIIDNVNSLGKLSDELKEKLIEQ